MKKNRVRILLGGIAAAIVIMALAFPVYVQYAGPEADNRLVTVGMGHHIIVIGTPVSAQGADYTCDGVDDHVQIQQAVNALPAGGGQIFILTGDYQWGNAQTVTRAIDNVSIVGVGHSVTFTGDGVTAIFSAGGNNWLFSNLEVDAGGITMGATTDWMWLNLTEAGTYYSVHTEDDEMGDVVGPSSATDNAIVRFDGATGKLIQDYTSDAPTISDTGDVTMGTGKTVDGRDISVDGGKLDSIESGATLYPDTGEQAFLDADHTKLDGVEAGADVTDATNVAAAGALMDPDTDNVDDTHINWGAAAGQVDADDVLESATRFWAGEAGATLYPDTGEQAFLDADHTKLDGVEAGADATDATNVAAAGAVMEVDYNAQTVLIAISDDSPTALVVGEQAVLGRLTGGNIAALNIGVSDNFIVQIDSGTITATEYARFTANGLESRSEAEFKEDFNLEIGTDVQAWDADLDELASLSDADSNFIVGSATGWVIESGETARASLGFPTDPGTDMYLMWDDQPTGELVWDAGGGDVGTDAIWDAKGDLAVGTGSNTADNLPVGTDDYILMADSAQDMGLEWIAPGTAAEIAQVQAAGTGSADTYARSDHIHAINHTITDNHIVTIDGTSNQPVSTDYAKFTADGLEGMDFSQVLVDLSGTATSTFDWNGQMLADWGIENGATVDATPVTGQFFLHTPTGRSVLLQYDGSSWVPIMSFGTMTVYVDNTDGTDAIDKGGAVDAGAFKSVTYAKEQIPGLYDGNVVINVNAESYSEDIVITGKRATASYTITLRGTWADSLASQTATGGTAGTPNSATQATVVKSGAGWTVDAYAGMWVRFASDTTTVALRGDIRIIESNTSDTLPLVGGLDAAPVSGDTFSVSYPGTAIGDGAGSAVQIRDGQTAVVVEVIDINSQYLYVTGQSDATFRYIDSSSSSNGWSVSESSKCHLDRCHINTVADGISVFRLAFLLLEGSFFQGDGGAGDYGLSIYDTAVVRMTTVACIFDNFNYGITIGHPGATGELSPQIGTTPNHVIRNCDTGMYAKYLAMANSVTSSNVSFDTCTLNTDDDPTTSAHIITS